MTPRDLSNEYCHFFDDDEFVATEREGFRQRIVTGERLQLCFWRIAGGATGSFLHRHLEQEQLGIVMRGALDFRIGESDATRVVLEAGDIYLAPEQVWHGDSIFIGDEEYGECWILDVFSPPRDDMRQPGGPARSLERAAGPEAGSTAPAGASANAMTERG